MEQAPHPLKMCPWVRGADGTPRVRIADWTQTGGEPGDSPERLPGGSGLANKQDTGLVLGEAEPHPQLPPLAPWW